MRRKEEKKKKRRSPLTQVEKQDSLQSSLLENEGLINRSEAVTQEYKILPFKKPRKPEVVFRLWTVLIVNTYRRMKNLRMMMIRPAEVSLLIKVLKLG